MNSRGAICAIALGSFLAVPVTTHAAVSQEKADKLGKELTCIGAKAAGNEEGTIPAFTGKYVGEVPGWDPEPHSGAHPKDPYADEKPKFTITADNLSGYTDHLSEGQIAMFKQYPETYKINVYPTHRDFGYPDFVCDRAKWNALNAKVVDDGMGVEGIGSIPFPIPENGLQLLWNQQLPYRDYTYLKTVDIASVQADGSIGYGRSESKCLAPSNNPHERPMATDGPSALCQTIVKLPTRERGNISMNHEPYNYTNPRLAWTYNAGTRRVRLSPGYGFDQSLGGSNGNMTIDDARLFNGSPERYNWELIGKKEMYVPANGYKPNSADITYDELLTPHHENPKYLRYELRRVWILEATLKDGSRHLYGKRRLFLDEDYWSAVMADNYDTRGNLWKHNIINYYYHPDTSAWYSGAAFYHDLTNGEYLGYNLTNERREGPILNKEDMKKSDYTPDRLRAIGR